MVAFHFPPMSGSSGIQRTLRFVQHLPAHGWQPIVLTAHPRAYASSADDLMADVPRETIVERAFALDTARHLSLAGRYPGLLARPDRWCTWALGAVPAGLRLIRKYRPEAIWSTYPIATAHLIALWLHRLSGIRLIADFRDPMAQEGYPEDPRLWRAYDRIERNIARVADRMVFATPSARAMYANRYAQLPADRFALIENGYDEESFAAAEQSLRQQPLTADRVTLLHSGIVYPSERDPRALFQALARMRSDGRADPGRLRVRFRAPVHTDLLQRLAAESRTQDMVEILPPIAYRDALEEMMRADGLLVMQGANCNEQVPAKLYEYFRARRPILGLADPAGDTGKVMLAAGVSHVAKLEDAAAVEAALCRFLEGIRPGAPQLKLESQFAQMSRRARTAELVGLLEQQRPRQPNP